MLSKEQSEEFRMLVDKWESHSCQMDDWRALTDFVNGLAVKPFVSEGWQLVPKEPPQAMMLGARASGVRDPRVGEMFYRMTLHAAPIPPIASQAVGMVTSTAAAHDVIAERVRQICAEDYTAQHDDSHVNDEIAAYACVYAMPPGMREWDVSSLGYGDTLGEAGIPYGWGPVKAGDRRRELVKAGALLLAEIERLDRAAMKVKP